MSNNEDYMQAHGKVTRVAVVDENGIVYESYNAVNVVTAVQDQGRTLKVFLGKGRELK